MVTHGKESLQEDRGRFSRVYRRLVNKRRAVAEPRTATFGAAGTPVREKLVRCLWFDQFLDPARLRTADGVRLSVFSPGYWNEASGPDFRNAEIDLGGRGRTRGDVEVHVLASDWERHGHGDDPAYRKVVLHVVLKNDLNSDAVFHMGRPIPQLALEPLITEDLDEILQSLDPDGYPQIGTGREGPCCRSIRALDRDAQWVGRFLDIAGDERMLTKAERFTALAEKSTPDEVMYEALMDCMGYAANRGGFRRLARAVPLSHLRRVVPIDAEHAQRILSVQAELFGAAGLLETEPKDAESREYVDELQRRRSASARGLERPALDRSVWVLKRTRPVNHPARRIAGLSMFLASHLHSGLCRAMLTAAEQIPQGGSQSRRRRGTIEAFRSLFEDKPDSYWSRRVTFGPPRLPRPMGMIGPTRAAAIVVNVAIPLLLALSKDDAGRTEDRLHNAYCSLGPGPDNSVTRYMKTRIFEDARQADSVVSSNRREQGLLQIFHDFCESDTATCEACGFLAAIEGRTG